MKFIKTRTIVIILFIVLVLAVIISTPYKKKAIKWVAYVILGILAGIFAIGEFIALMGRRKELDSFSTKIDVPALVCL